MNSFIDAIGQQVFGMTRTSAHEAKVCICCHKPVFNEDGTYSQELFHSEAGEKEYGISGMCEKCFDNMFGGSDD